MTPSLLCIWKTTGDIVGEIETSELIVASTRTLTLEYGGQRLEHRLVI